MDETQSRSVWTFVDEGSGPLKQAATSLETLSAKLGKAERASAAMSKQLGMDAGGVSADLEKAQQKQERENQKQERLAQKREADSRRLGLMQLEAGEMNKAFDEKKAGATPANKTENDLIQEEMKARRMRLKTLKFEEARGNIYGGILQQVTGQTAKFGLAANEMAEKGAGVIGAMEGIGFQMTSMGGKMGSIGTKLVGLAGPIGLGIAGAGLVYEGGKYLYEKLMDRSKEELKAAKAAGFAASNSASSDKDKVKAGEAQAVANYKMAQAAEKELKERSRIEASVGRAVTAIPAKPIGPGDTAEAQETYSNALLEAARKTSNTFEIPLDTALKMYEDAMGNAQQTVMAQAQREAELTDIEKKLISSISVLPYNANADAVFRHTVEVNRAIDQARERNEIGPLEAASVTKNLLARTETDGSLQSMAEKNYAVAQANADLQVQIAALEKTLPKVPVHATMKQLTAFNKAVLLAEQTFALGNKDATPEDLKEVHSKLSVSKPPVFNFSNSRFDIKQAFAEGFDPDRIAVAFTNDLAMLGERRLQSGLAPINAARISGG